MKIVLDSGFKGSIGIEFEGHGVDPIEGILATKRLIERGGEIRVLGLLPFATRISLLNLEGLAAANNHRWSGRSPGPHDLIAENRGPA